MLFNIIWLTFHFDSPPPIGPHMVQSILVILIQMVSLFSFHPIFCVKVHFLLPNCPIIEVTFKYTMIVFQQHIYTFSNFLCSELWANICCIIFLLVLTIVMLFSYNVLFLLCSVLFLVIANTCYFFTTVNMSLLSCVLGCSCHCQVSPTF